MINLNKKIIHIDMDCFYAQVEMRDDPKLKNLPVAVGGLPGTRSVLCTSNYQARKFGVKSAMPTDLAIKLCPQLKIIEPNFSKYQLVSNQILSILEKYSDLIEPVSLDEAYLDVSTYERASQVAKEIKNEIYKKTSLTASIGLAPNKFLSKIASDWKKPDGFFVILPTDIEAFINTLPVKLIPGVGKKNEEILLNLGVKTCNDLQKFTDDALYSHFGKFGIDLKNFSNGIDFREVVSGYERKSLSTEETFLNDLHDVSEINLKFEDLFHNIKNQLQKYGNENDQTQIKKLFVKVKFNDFSKSSTEISLKEALECKNFDEDLFLQYSRLLSQSLSKNNLPIRLLGIGVRFLASKENTSPQPELPFLQNYE